MQSTEQIIEILNIIKDYSGSSIKEFKKNINAKLKDVDSCKEIYHAINSAGNFNQSKTPQKDIQNLISTLPINDKIEELKQDLQNKNSQEIAEISFKTMKAAYDNVNKTKTLAAQQKGFITNIKTALGKTDEVSDEESKTDLNKDNEFSDEESKTDLNKDNEFSDEEQEILKAGYKAIKAFCGKEVFTKELAKELAQDVTWGESFKAYLLMIVKIVTLGLASYVAPEAMTSTRESKNTFAKFEEARAEARAEAREKAVSL